MTWKVEDAELFARKIHQNQFDKGGRPYIEHALSVRDAVKGLGEDYQVVALLHDTVEDCEGHERTAVIAYICEVFGLAILRHVLALTREEGESYHRYIQRCAKDPLTAKVKIADLLNNMQADRLPSPLTQKDIDRMEKYSKALTFLRENQCLS
jgi:(p)ppGpp synthase/HD superfamily hydrolase